MRNGPQRGEAKHPFRNVIETKCNTNELKHNHSWKLVD